MNNVKKEPKYRTCFLITPSIRQNNFMIIKTRIYPETTKGQGYVAYGGVHLTKDGNYSPHQFHRHLSYRMAVAHLKKYEKNLRKYSKSEIRSKYIPYLGNVTIFVKKDKVKKKGKYAKKTAVCTK